MARRTQRHINKRMEERLKKMKARRLAWANGVALSLEEAISYWSKFFSPIHPLHTREWAWKRAGRLEAALYKGEEIHLLDQLPALNQLRNEKSVIQEHRHSCFEERNRRKWKPRPEFRVKAIIGSASPAKW